MEICITVNNCLGVRPIYLWFIVFMISSINSFALISGLGVQARYKGLEIAATSEKISNKSDVKKARSGVQESSMTERPNLPKSGSEATQNMLQPTEVTLSDQTDPWTEQPPIQAVWCYCNFPQCVPKGYMCLSQENGACFSKRALPQSSNESSEKGSGHYNWYRHATESLSSGCVEFLPQSEQLECKKKLGLQFSQKPEGALHKKTLERFGVIETSREGQDNDIPNKTDLRCCSQNMCNYELIRPIIIRSIEGRDASVSRKVSWLEGATIGVSVAGVFILVFLFVSAGRMLTKDLGVASDAQNSSTRDYFKSPYYIERTSSLRPPREEECSMLCAKSLQKRQYVADYCRFHPLSSSNRHSTSCPSSLSSCSTLLPNSSRESTRAEELHPLTCEEAFPVEPPEGALLPSTSQRQEEEEELQEEELQEKEVVLVHPSSGLGHAEDLLLNS